MRWGWPLLALIVLSVASLAADQTENVLTLPCPQSLASEPGCNPSKTDLHKAKSAFARGLRLEKSHRIDQAYEEFDTAARLVPRNIDYITAVAVTREELVSEHIRKGNTALENGRAIEAQAEFRSALNLDPQNQFSQQRLQDALAEWAPQTDTSVRVVQESGESQVVPTEELHSFHFRGDSRALLAQVANTFGLTAEVEESVPSRRVRFDVENADFQAAMRAACDVTGAFWAPVAEKQIVLAKESPENHRLYDRMAMRTFRLTSATTQKDVQDLLNMLRIVFEIRFVMAKPNGLIIVRAPAPLLDAATQFLENFGKARPEVMLDFQVFEIDHQLTRNLGVHIPNNFNLFNIPAAALLALGGQNAQSLINQLISGGGINQANAQAISGLLAQLQNQQSSIFSQPLATFGGGLTLMGVSLDTLAAQLSLNQSLVRLLDHAILRAGNGNDAAFLLGQRYPIINATFAPIFNSSAISQVLQNGSFQAPVPSISYEDLGLDIKAKPVVTANSDVELQLDMQLRNLAGQSLNGVPVIANRQYKGSIRLEDGEPAMVAASLTLSEARNLTGIPGLGSVPGLNMVASTTTNSAEEDELLIVITPHVVSLEPGQAAEVWLAK